MAQTPYTNGQPAVTTTDLKNMLTQENAAYLRTGVDFLTPHKYTLPLYASGYTGSYYRKQSSSSTFSSATYAAAYGSFYEEALPTDCTDDGIHTVEVTFGTSGVVAQANITNATDETTWDTTNANTTKVFWRQEGRKVKWYLPTSVSSSATLKWSADYTRYPTYPTLDGDTLDIPAEDVDTYYAQWKSNVLLP